MLKLNIGSGPNVFPFDGWLNYDRVDMNFYFNEMRAITIVPAMPEHQKRLIDYLQNSQINFRAWDLRKGFPQHEDNSVDCIYLGQVIEHVNPLYEAPKLISECYRMLKPGGVLRITTPDLNILVDSYVSGRMDDFEKEQPEFYKSADPGSKLAYIMFGACGHACTWDHYEGHMFMYSKKSMAKLLSESGFKNMEFYWQPGKSHSPVLAVEAVDAGMSHSFVSEGIK